MINLIERFFSKEKSNKTQLRQDFSTYFFSLPEHAWLLNSQTKKHFEKLFSHLPVGVLEALMRKYPIMFITNDALRKKQSAGTILSNTIVVFPEFQKMLQTNNTAAVAYLAHELAFVLYELEEAHVDPLMAEVEADKFVCDIGLGHELEQHLLHLDETIERRLRLTYLTINYFTRENN